jgi:hypothetical protein
MAGREWRQSDSGGSGYLRSAPLSRVGGADVKAYG